MSHTLKSQRFRCFLSEAGGLKNGSEEREEIVYGESVSFYDQLKEQQFMRSVRDFINQALRRSGKSYHFTVSIGCCRSIPDPDDKASIQSEAEQYLRNADQAMYEEKQASSERRE